MQVEVDSAECGAKPSAADLKTACAEMDYASDCLRCIDRHNYAVFRTDAAPKTCVHCPSGFGCFIENGKLYQYTANGT